MQTRLAIATWIVIAGVLTTLINLLPWKVQPITAAVLVYSSQDSPIPILFSPFLIQGWNAVLARTAQFSWLAMQSHSSRLSPIYFAKVYPILLAARAVSGFVFSRSVGWKYPHLFSHYALYEPVTGFGPLLLGSLLFDEIRDQRELFLRHGTIFAFALLDAMPWSYTCAAAIAGIYRLAQSFTMEGKYSVLPWHTPDSQATPDGPPLSRTRIFALSVAAMCLSGSTGVMTAAVSHILPSSPPAPHDVHVVMLTVPRTRDPSSDVMIDSVKSYVEPWRVNENSTITVFAHLGLDGKHLGYGRAKALFQTTASASAVPITFYTEPPPPEGLPVMNHHAHLADAMRYAYGRGYEWTMFVEDDFVLCEEWGWEGFMGVMKRLNEVKTYNGAFIGTGGSGLIFHRSLLPTLEQLMTMMAVLSKDDSYQYIPPDVLLQQCLSGEILLCPNNGWVISSRMLMGHRGGVISTGNRIYDDGKWACGWRHPQHGKKGADVVVV